MKKVLLVAFLIVSVFTLNACGDGGCEGGGCRDKIKSHSKSRGR